MLRLIAKWFAKTRYVFNQHVEAATNDLNAGLALRTAQEKRDLAARITKDADEMDARIKELDTKMEQGFWECENGHEYFDPQAADRTLTASGVICRQCDYKTEMKFIKRDLMTGQEKYESDKERAEAQKMAADKRAQAKTEEDNAANSEKTAQYFRNLAQNNRTVAEKVRRL